MAAEEILEMAENELPCPRCGFPMEKDPEVYAIPHGKRREQEPQGSTVSVEKSRIVQIFRCPNRSCQTIEMKAGPGWPVLSR